MAKSSRRRWGRFLSRNRQQEQPAIPVRLNLECLEDRLVLSTLGRVADIAYTEASSSPAALANLNGTLFFAADDGVNGVELWKSDGTSAGTTMVADIVSGSGSSNPTSLANVNGTLFFAADDGANGTELWQSDGTPSGTTMVADLYSGSGSSNPTSLTNVNGTLFFVADDGVYGTELWQSDGTPSGTTLVADLVPGEGSRPTSLANISGTLFFAADGGTGSELWKSDGTSAGTTLVQDINSVGGSNPHSITNVNGTAFFSATDGSYGYELWRSNGTSAGTVPVTDINPGSASSSPSSLVNFNGTLFFAADDGTYGRELWSYDGVNASLFRDISSASGSSNPTSLVDVAGTLFFAADDGTYGIEVWSSNGTVSGTALCQDINSGSGSANPTSLTNVSGTLFFAADDGIYGVELWRSGDFTPPPAPVLTNPASATTVNAASFPIEGSAEADSLVQIYADANDNGMIDAGESVVAQVQLTGGSTTFAVDAPLNQDADNNFLVTASDAEGNESTPTDVPTLTEDSTPPAAPTLTAPTAATTVNAPTSLIAGSAEADSLVQIYADSNDNGLVDAGEMVVAQQQLMGGSTSFSLSVPLAQDAVNSFLVTASDAAGNESARSDVPNITEDSTPPSAPTLTAPLAPLTVNANTYPITGTAEADSLVQIYRDLNDNGMIDAGESVVAQVQLAGGSTTFAVDAPLNQDASNHFLVTASDAAGNESLVSAVPTITEDSTPPSAPTLTAPTVATTINAPTFLIEGSAEADSLVQIYQDSNDNGLVDAGEMVVAQQQLMGGSTSFSLSVALAQDAGNSFLVTASDAAGNESTPANVPNITEDSTPPAAPTLTAPTATEILNADSILIAGSAEADSLVQIYADANDNGMVDAGEMVVAQQQLMGGSTSFSLSVALTQDAVNSFLVTAADAASNESPVSDVPNITEDSTPPSAPTLTSPLAPLTVNANTYPITGTAEADSLVQIYRDLNNNGMIDQGEPVVAQVQLMGGSTTFAVDAPLNQDASNHFLVTASDAAGNESPPSDVPTITEDSTPPSAPTLTAPTAPIAVNAATFLIEGTAVADGLVLIYADANDNGVADAGEMVVAQQQLLGGNTSFSLSVPLAQDAVNSFLVTAADVAGNESAASDVPNITEDSTPPSAPTLTVPLVATSVDAATFLIEGSAEADSLVRIYQDSNDNGMVDAGEMVVAQQQLMGGSTSFSLSVSLTQDAVNSFLVTASDAVGNESAASDVPNITEDSTAPSAPTLTSPLTATAINANTYTITGTAEANSLITIYRDQNNNGVINPTDLMVAQVQLTGGSTAFAVDAPLNQDADNHFLVTASDAAGNESPPSDVPTITEDSTAPSAPTLTAPTAPTTINAATFLIEGTAVADGLVLIYADANDNGVADAGEMVVAQQQLLGGNTSFSLSVPLAQDAVNSFLVTAADAVGNESTPADVPNITEDSTPPSAPTLTAPTAPIAVNATSFVIEGTAEANSLVRIYEDSNDNGMVDEGDMVVAQQQLSGSTSFSLSVSLTQDAVNSFFVTASDVAFNESTPANVPNITEDSIPPSAPVVTLPAAPLLINADQIPLAGTAEADSLVQVFQDLNNNGIVDSGEPLVAQQQLSGGATSYSVIVNLNQDASNHFLVTASDAAGNESSPTAVPEVVEDSTPGNAPVLTNPTETVTINAFTFPITGTADVDSLVQIYRDENNNNQVDEGEPLVTSVKLTGTITSFALDVPLIQDSPNHFLVTATDLAGNESAPADVPDIVEDSIAPAIPLVTSPPDPVVLNAATFLIEGSAEADSLVRIYEDQNDNGVFDEGETIAAEEQLSGGSTSFSLSVSLAQDAVNSFLVTASDAAFNESTPADVPNITEDSTAPSVPTLTSPTGSTTVNADTYPVTGTVEADSLVQIYRDLNNDGLVDQGEPVVAQVQLMAGSSTFSLNVPLNQDASNHFLVTASDAALNESPPADVPDIIEDSTPPSAPTLTSPLFPVTINAATFLIEGTVEANSLVRIYEDQNDNGVVEEGETIAAERQLSGGSTSFALSVSLAQDAVNSFLVTASDAAFNESTPADVPNITEDSTPPESPVVTQPAGTLTINADDMEIRATVEADSFVQIYRDSNNNGTIDEGEPVVGEAQLSRGASAASIVVPLLQDAVNSFLVTASDIAGNESIPTAVPDITEDSIPPAPPVLASPLAPTSVNASSFSITGTAEANSLVRIYRDSNDNGVVDAGEFVVAERQLIEASTSFARSVSLNQDAVNSFLVTASDAAGNESTPADVPNITEDSIPPEAPRVTVPLAPISVNADTFLIEGTTEANSLVRIYRDSNDNGVIDEGEPVVARQPLAGGSTSFSVSVVLIQGTPTENAINSFLVTASDAAGNESARSDVPNITEDSTPPVTPTITAPAAPLPLNADTFAIAGTAEANSQVQIYRDSNNNGLVDAGELVVGQQQLTGGSTSFSVSVALLQDAGNRFLVTASDAAGNESAPFRVPAITEDSTAPIPPTITTPSAATAVNAADFTIAGNAEVEALVQLYRDLNGNGTIDEGDPVLLSQMLENGASSFSLRVPLNQDQINAFLLTATDAAGNESDPARVPDLIEDSTPPTAPSLTQPLAVTTVNAGAFTIEGQAEANGLVRVYRDLNRNNVIDAEDFLVGQQQLGGGTTSFSVTVPLILNSINSFLVTTRDAAGNESARTDVPDIIENALPNNLTLILSRSSVVEGSPVTLSGRFADSGTNDTHTVTIDWGDGLEPTVIALGPGAIAFQADHTYADDQSPTSPVALKGVQVTVADNRGGSTTGSVAVTVQNAAPLLSPLEDVTLSVGTSLLQVISWIDPGSDSFRLRVDFGDLPAPQEFEVGLDQTFTLQHTFNQEGTFPVTVTVVDDEGAMDTVSFLAHIFISGVDLPSVNISSGALPGEVVTAQTTGVQAVLIRGAGGTEPAGILVAMLPEAVDQVLSATQLEEVDVSYDVRAFGVTEEDVVVVTFQYQGDGEPRLRFFDPVTGTLMPFQGSIDIDREARTITIILDNSSTPRLVDTTGTIFTIAVPSTVSVSTFSAPAAASPAEIPVPLFALESSSTSLVSANLNANSSDTGSSLVAQGTQESASSSTLETSSGGGASAEADSEDQESSHEEEPLEHLPPSNPVLIAPLPSTVAPSKPEDLAPLEEPTEEKPEKPAKEDEEEGTSETSTSLLDNLAPEVIAQESVEEEKVDSLDQLFSSGTEDEPTPAASWPYLLEAATLTALAGGLLTLPRRSRRKKRRAGGVSPLREDS